MRKGREKPVPEDFKVIPVSHLPEEVAWRKKKRNILFFHLWWLTHHVSIFFTFRGIFLFSRANSALKVDGGLHDDDNRLRPYMRRIQSQ